MSIDARAVKALRDKTGAGMMDCKAALVEASGDPAKAEELLRRRGLARAESLTARPTAAGRIGAYVHYNGRFAAMVELTCETDFVAETADFKELLADLCMQVVGAAPEYVSKSDIPPERLAAERTALQDEVRSMPPEIAAKVIEGKLAKNFYACVCLLEQPFFDPDKCPGTVAEHIRSVMSKVGENITVRRFARFELGA